MHRTPSPALRLGLGLASPFVLWLAGCASDGPRSGLPYPIDTTVIIRPDGTTASMRTPNGSDCIDLASGCVSPQTLCMSELARVDLVVDANENLIEYVCYPIEDNGSVIVATDANTVANSPGAVVVIPDQTVISGNVDLNGANTVVYGEVGESAIIDGDVRLSGQDTIARGVRITGDLELFGGGTAALFVIVEGNVIVTGNNAVLANSVVFGNVMYSGSGFDFVGNAVQNGLNATAPLATCADNQLFSDVNTDFALARATEITGPLVCP